MGEFHGLFFEYFSIGNWYPRFPEPMKNYFEILQVPENSSRDDVQRSYRRLAKLYHPDVNKSPDAHERFCEITEAYEFIMNHWPWQTIVYDDYIKTEAFEKFRQEAREKAHRQARMRYEKFKKHHEAFQESGINDIALLLTIAMRLISIILFLLLFLMPVVLSVVNHWTFMFLALFMWPFAGIIGWYIRDNRKSYLMPGTLYYTPARIRNLYTEKHPSDKPCHYCPNKTANSKPYPLELLKLKEIKYGSGGFRQHNVNYVNQNISIMVPRSQKAFVIHSVNILVKIMTILLCLVFLNITSIVWRLVLGMASGGLLSSLILLTSRTKSNTSYLFSLGMIIRIVIWLFSIMLASIVTTKPVEIVTTDSIYFVITAIIIFDSFLMQLLGFLLGKYASLPLTRQYVDAELKFKEGYQVYNDIPVLSVVYPLFRWIFG
jgi:hypothetical protein